LIGKNFVKVENKAEKILSSSALLALEKKLGKEKSEKLIQSFSEINNITGVDLFSNYSVLESFFKMILEDDANQAFEDIIAEIENIEKRKFLDMSLKEIYDQLREKYVFEYINGLSKGEHIVVLWNDKSFRDRFMISYFHPKYGKNVPRLFFSQVEGKIPDVDTKLFTDYIKMDKQLVVEKTLSAIADSKNKNRTEYPTLIACEDDTWWFKTGLENEIIGIEEGIGITNNENQIVVCSYNYDRLSKNLIETLTNYHHYVILDSPCAVYELKQA